MNLKIPFLLLSMAISLNSTFARGYDYDRNHGRYGHERPNYNPNPNPYPNPNYNNPYPNPNPNMNESTSIVMPGGMEIRHGQTQIITGYRPFRAGRININDDVITDSMREGKVVGIFTSDMKVIVRDSFFGMTRTLPISNVAVTNGCINSFCVGDKVITSSLGSATVRGYFADGTIVVKDSFFSSLSRVNASSLGITTGCTYQFCVGDKTITRSDRNATVVGFFSNGTIILKDSFFNQNMIAKPEDLALTSGVCTNIFTRRVRYCR